MQWKHDCLHPCRIPMCSNAASIIVVISGCPSDSTGRALAGAIQGHHHLKLWNLPRENSEIVIDLDITITEFLFIETSTICSSCAWVASINCSIDSPHIRNIVNNHFLGWRVLDYICSRSSTSTTWAAGGLALSQPLLLEFLQQL